MNLFIWFCLIYCIFQLIEVIYSSSVNTGSIVILRGPAAAGKSSAARELLKRWRGTGHHVALIDWDYYKSYMFGNDDPYLMSSAMEASASNAMSRNYSVLIEGTIWRPGYDGFFRSMHHRFPHRIFSFYWNVTLEETLRRHAGRGRKEDVATLRKWYMPVASQVFPYDVVIPQSYSLNYSVSFIENIVQLR